MKTAYFQVQQMIAKCTPIPINLNAYPGLSAGLLKEAIKQCGFRMIQDGRGNFYMVPRGMQ